MLIAHLPAGYILGRVTRSKGAVLGVILAASILPDLDMLWFHLVDGGRVHHHRYWPHVPGFWLMVAVIIMPVIAVLKRPWLLPAALTFGAIALHLVLDTLVGGVMWLWPFSNAFTQLATVSPTHGHWIISFMFHWSFAIEILIFFTALYLYNQRRKI